jgi:hypothetical protein
MIVSKRNIKIQTLYTKISVYNILIFRVNFIILMSKYKIRSFRLSGAAFPLRMTDPLLTTKLSLLIRTKAAPGR